MLLFQARKKLRDELEPPHVQQLLLPLTTLFSRFEVIALTPRAAGALGAVALAVGVSASAPAQADPPLAERPMTSRLAAVVSARTPVAAVRDVAAPKPAATARRSSGRGGPWLGRCSANTWPGRLVCSGCGSHAGARSLVASARVLGAAADPGRRVANRQVADGEAADAEAAGRTRSAAGAAVARLPRRAAPRECRRGGRRWGERAAAASASLRSATAHSVTER